MKIDGKRVENLWKWMKIDGKTYGKPMEMDEN